MIHLSGKTFGLWFWGIGLFHLAWYSPIPSIYLQIWKKCLTSLVVTEIQIKTTLRFHLTPIRMAIIKNTNNNWCWYGCGGEGTRVHCWWSCKLVQPLWKAVWRFLRKLGMDPPFDPDIPLHGLYPKDLKIAYYSNAATSMFIAAQFTVNCGTNLDALQQMNG